MDAIVRWLPKILSDAEGAQLEILAEAMNQPGNRGAMITCIAAGLAERDDQVLADVLELVQSTPAESGHPKPQRTVLSRILRLLAPMKHAQQLIVEQVLEQRFSDSAVSRSHTAEKLAATGT